MLGRTRRSGSLAGGAAAAEAAVIVVVVLVMLVLVLVLVGVELTTYRLPRTTHHPPPITYHLPPTTHCYFAPCARHHTGCVRSSTAPTPTCDYCAPPRIAPTGRPG